MVSESKPPSIEATEDEIWHRELQNIAPCRRGRRIEDLVHALSLTPAERKKEFNEKKQSFIRQFLAYKGDDPLPIWHSYLTWLEQNAVHGGNEGGFRDVLKKFLLKLAPDLEVVKRNGYYDKHEYVALFLLAADNCEDPVRVYEYMFEHGVGKRSVKFYRLWATALRNKDRFEDAMHVYDKALVNLSEQNDLRQIDECRRTCENSIALKAMESLSLEETTPVDVGDDVTDYVRPVTTRRGLSNIGGFAPAVKVKLDNEGNVINCSQSLRQGFDIAQDSEAAQISYPYLGEEKISNPAEPFRAENKKPMEKLCGLKDESLVARNMDESKPGFRVFENSGVEKAGGEKKKKSKKKTLSLRQGCSKSSKIVFEDLLAEVASLKKQD